MPKRPKAPRSERVFTIAYWTIVSVFATWVAWLLYRGVLQINLAAEWIAGLGMIVMAVTTAYIHFRRRIVRRFLSPHQGFICPACHYPLRNLPDVGECPECGTSYTRSGIVQLWFTRYRVGASYPQTAPPDSPSRLETRPATPSTPWSSRSMSAAASGVEALARRNGYRSPRLAAYASELALAAGRRGKAFPSEVEALYMWFDPAMWAAALGASGPESLESSWEEVAAAPASHRQPRIKFRRPDDLRTYQFGNRSPGSAVLDAFAEHRQRQGDADAWVATTLIEIADTAAGACVMYCPDPPDSVTPYLLTFVPGHSDRVWLADSIAGWLIRLALCDGHEPVLHPELLTAIPQEHRVAFLQEFALRNPGSSLFAGVAG